MAVIKCKMCGGDLNLIEGQSVAECEYCGSRQTVPTADNEKKLTLFARANRLRAGGEFDKAAGIYETIVADFPEEAEAYWGLVLCKYGIEYVDDPATGKKIPTCHRSSFDSILEDSDFEQACENADAVARKIYREEAKQIEEIRRGIIEVSGKEEPYDIFICYKETDENGERTIDSVIAQDVYDALTAKGYRVFFSRITLEDKLGQEYEPYIFAALNSAKIMLAFGTDYEYFNAVWVKNEWSRFLKLMEKEKSKHLIPCYKGLDAYDMPKEFARLQAQDMGKVGAMQDLLRGVEKLLGAGQKENAQAIAVRSTGGPTVESLLTRGQIFLEDKVWAKADEYFDRVLDIAPQCAEAYLGKFCSKNRYTSPQKIGKRRADRELFQEPNFEKALRFAAPQLRAELDGYTASALKLYQQHLVLDVLRKIEAKKESESNIARLVPLRKKLKKASGILCITDGVVLGLKTDGRVVAVSDYKKQNLDVSRWTDITAIAGGYCHAVGLKSGGTVVAAGNNDYGQCDISGWSDIVAVSAGRHHTVGLKSDGTVVAVGRKNDHQCDVNKWLDIVAVSAGGLHTVGLKSDGTVVAVGENKINQGNVSDWSDIVAVSAGGRHTVGLKSDGTVVAVGNNNYHQCDVSGWRDIMAVSAGWFHTVGLKSDGTVVAVGCNTDPEGQQYNGEFIGQCDVGSWTDIVAVSAGNSRTVGLKSDGTVVAVGNNEQGQCNVSGWKLFNSVNTLEQERQEAIKRREQEAEEVRRRREQEAEAARKRREEQKAALEREKSALEAELANLKGFFTGKRRREIEARLAQIRDKLKAFN